MDQRRRILLVDDEANVLYAMRDALARLGCEVEIVTAQNGKKALDEVRAQAFDLIVTDLRMPEMGGVQLTEAVKAIHPATVVIWMTAYDWGDATTSSSGSRIPTPHARAMTPPIPTDLVRPRIPFPIWSGS